jgi:hypothetical protein
MDAKTMTPEAVIAEIAAWAEETGTPEVAVAERLGVSVITWRGWKSALRGATLPRFTRDSLKKLRTWVRPEAIRE